MNESEIRDAEAELVPWLLVAVEDANELDYITAEQRKIEMNGELPS